MKQLRISPDLALPISAVTSTQIVYGGKGMGKTNLGAVMLEEMSKAGLRWRLLDPLGVSYGLRHSKDGKGKGVECLILGGVHGDLPIEPTAGAVVADFIVDEDVNVIVDFSRRASGEMWSIGEKVRFLTDVALRAFQRQGSLIDGRRRDPFFLMLDEAARYIPQMIPAGRQELAFCVGAWEQLVEEGRNIGIGVGLLTQRSARMNKSVSELADVVFAFRTIGPNSLQAILDWLGDHVEKSRIKQLVEEIRSLDVGRCLVVSPGWLKHEGVIQIRERETFDSSATPRPGERQKKVSGAAAAPDLAKYSARMAETIEKAKAADPRELQKEIARLRKELATANNQVVHALHPPAKGPGRAPDPAVLQRHVNAGVAAAMKEEWKRLRQIKLRMEEARRVFAGANAAVAKLPALVDGGIAALDMALESLLKDSPAPTPVLAHVETTRGVDQGTVASSRSPRQNTDARNIASTNGDLSGVEQRILDTLRGLEDLGISPADKATTAALVGYHPNAKSYSNALGSLRTAGRVAYPQGGTLALTDAGRALAVSQLQVSSTEELHRVWYQKLGRVAERILKPLIESYPEPRSAAEIAEAAGYHPNAKSFSNMKGRLRTLGLIDYPTAGTMAATDILFPAGLS